VLGKNACSIDVSTQLFGDPCYGTPKHFDASLTCSGANATLIIAIEAAVPANARATVRLPIPAAVPPVAVTVREGSVVIFSGGAFVPGTAGVYGAAARANDVPRGWYTIDVEVGAGTFSLSATR